MNSQNNNEDSKIQELIAQGAIFLCSHSGGKDSQAMYLKLKDIVPAKQLIVVHADLSDVEWAGTYDHIVNTVEAVHPIYKVKAERTFVEMVRHRGMFPSSQTRQCTSDLKTNPIFKFIKKEFMKEGGLLVNCLGLRAQESSGRANKPSLEINTKQTTKKLKVYNWLPIHHWSTRDVFKFIEINGQLPHEAYLKGMSRLSCAFCIMSNRQDLRVSAQHNPELLEKIAQLEEEVNHTMFFVNGESIKIKDYINLPYKRKPKELETYQKCVAA